MRIAVLDPDKNHVGYKTADSVGENEVEVPENCDLVPGRYRWCVSRGTFLARTDVDVGGEEFPTNPLRILAMALRDIEAGGVVFSAPVLAWLTEYETTVDGAGNSVVRRG